jgi:hypothetical protein
MKLELMVCFRCQPRPHPAAAPPPRRRRGVVLHRCHGMVHPLPPRCRRVVAAYTTATRAGVGEPQQLLCCRRRPAPAAPPPPPPPPPRLLHGDSRPAVAPLPQRCTAAARAAPAAAPAASAASAAPPPPLIGIHSSIVDAWAGRSRSPTATGVGAGRRGSEKPVDADRAAIRSHH